MIRSLVLSSWTLERRCDSLLSSFMRKKSRLFAIAEALRARRTGVTAQQLADRFGVTLRTIYRDLEALQDAGMPIKADRGRGGGYALDKNYQLPPINFTAREAALLVALARLAVEQRLIPFPNAIERAADKVKRALSTSAQRELLGADRRAAARRRPRAAGPGRRARRDRDRVVRVARAAHRLREVGVAAQPAPRADPQPRVRSLGHAAQLRRPRDRRTIASSASTGSGKRP